MTFEYRKERVKREGNRTERRQLWRKFDLAKIAFNLRLIPHLGEHACFDPLMLDEHSMNGRDSSLSLAYTPSLYTPEIVIALRGITVNCIVDL